MEEEAVVSSTVPSTLEAVVPCPEWDETVESRMLRWGKPYEGINETNMVVGILDILAEDA